MKTLKTLTLVLALSTLSAFAQGGGGNSVAGTWKVTGDVSGNPVDQVCTFTQDSKKLTGSCKSAGADKPTEFTGEMNDKKVTWQYETDYQGQKLTVAFTGALDAAGSQLKGDIDVQPVGVSGTFTAQKQEAKKEEPQKPQ